MYNNDKKVTVGFPLNVVETSPDNDFKYGPYSSVDAALNALGENGSDCICAGLKFGVKQSDGSVKEYKFKKGIANASDLVCEEDLINQLKSIIGELSNLSTSAKSSIVASLNEIKNAVDNVNVTASGWTSGQITMLDTILKEAVFASDQSANIQLLKSSLMNNSTGGGDLPVYYSVMRGSLSNCSISLANTSVQNGGNAIVTIEPNEGYSVSSSGITISGNYSSYSYEGNTLTIVGVASDISVSVNAAIKTYSVSASGTSCSAALSSSNVNHGSNVTVTFSPSSGYTLSESGISITGTYTSKTFSNNVLTVNGVKSNLYISATAVLGSKTYYQVSYNLSNSLCNPSISQVEAGTGFSAVVSPVDGYKLDDVSVTMGGVDITLSSYNQSTNTITIVSVTNNVSVAATSTEIVAPGESSYYDDANALFTLSDSVVDSKGATSVTSSNFISFNGEDGALSSRSSGNYGIRLGSENFNNFKSFVIEYKHTRTSAGWYYIFGLMRPSVGTIGIGIKSGTDNLFYTTANDTETNIPLLDGWNRIGVAVNNSRNATFYLNGSKLFELTSTDAATDLIIGNNYKYVIEPGASRSCNGSIRNVAMWNEILDDSVMIDKTKL